MRVTASSVGMVLTLVLSAPGAAQPSGLVEIHVEGLSRASFITAPVGQTVIVTSSTGSGETLLVTPISVLEDKFVELVILEVGSTATPLQRVLAIGEPVEVTAGSSWIRITPTAIDQHMLISTLMNTAKSKPLPGLNSLCCLSTGDGSRCGCRVRVGDACCAEPPCSCGHLY